MSLITSTAPKAPPRPAVPRSIRLDSLTGLRWCAAALIFCYHFSFEESAAGSGQHVGQLRHLTLAGPSAVSFFFVLSGFVLAWSARTADTAGGFWRRRFARIYPSHAVTFCVAVVMLLWMGLTLDPLTGLANLTLTQAWVPDPEVWFGYNGVSWSLSCEFFFYFAFPFLIGPLRRLRSRGLWAVVAAGNLFVVLFPLYGRDLAYAAGWHPKFLLYLLPPVRLAEFVVGIALALLVRNGSWRGPGLGVSLGLSCAAALWLVHLVPYDFHWSACTIVPYTLTIAAAAHADARGSRSPFRNRVLVYLGEISFSFYLVHEMVIFGTNHFFFTHHLSPALWLDTLLVLGVSLAGAALLHRYVEKPGVRLLSRGRPKPRPAAT
ncbi:hypothetical protein BLA24_22450 [Streptomyces cinnamoneus]|uniref:Acyltransferase 3 domain-containing protein n=1 Tax=Streptomyces cinnamoneus TaxID=53446 RepID=A0A2G1XGF0_STRCJ|nr:acyltransferase [Streptomyces cinnamoneus]PHQ50312.1 hypothetical protein BLA24_22450 [Streptomyces cinnamoneus]PPT12901.1 acyltransferase [Streptomyces cinnamoneus]